MFEQRDLSFIYKYFTGEKQESLLFLVIGIAAVMLAVVFFFFIRTNPSLFKGTAIPLLAIGMIQAIVGYTVYARSDKQRMDVAYKVGIEPVRFIKMEELPRMKKVMADFSFYRLAEILCGIIGLVMVFVTRTKPGKIWWYGFGLALALQAVLMLCADLVAEKRAKEYIKKLEQIIYPN